MRCVGLFSFSSDLLGVEWRKVSDKIELEEILINRLL
jgi:hypothetical protein